MITILPDNLGTIKESIKYLLDKASQSEEVRALAIEVTVDQDKIAAIYNFARSNIRYTPDPIDMELFTSPVRMVNEYRQGKILAEDCDGIAIFVTALYRAIGLQSNVVLLGLTSRELDHAVSQVYSDILNRWILVDAVPLGWEISYVEKIIV